MGVVGVNCIRGFIPLDEHYECMTHPDHPCAYTADILDAMLGPNKERIVNNVLYSPSSMLGCRRQKILSKDNDFFVSVDGAWVMQRGQMAHAYAETLPPPRGSLGVLREVRLKSMVKTSKGFEWFAGKMDAVVLNYLEATDDGFVLHVSIIDYKSKGEIGHGPDTHLTNNRLLPGQAAAQRGHQQQVNLYAWLVRNELAGWLNMRFTTDLGDNEYHKLHTEAAIPIVTSVVVDELIIQYLDFAKARRFSSLGPLKARGRRMPDHKTYEQLELLPIFVSSHDYLTRWITRHIEMEYQAEIELPPPITGEDSKKFCYRCPVRNICYTVGREEGYEMAEQAPLS